MNAIVKQSAINLRELATKVDNHRVLKDIAEIHANEELLLAINKQVSANDTACVFIYDTLLDYDNGAWTDKATWQSWYGETLNSNVRGSTKKFPKVSLIVVETGRITIYDANDLNCPMWMVFTLAGGGQIGPSDTFRVVTAKNGILYAGSDSGLFEINFVLDRAYQYSASTLYRKAYPILYRNVNNPPIVVSGRSGIVNVIVQDIVITQDTYGNNIAYVATDGGLSRIAPDGSVSNWTDDGNAVNVVKSITADDNFVYWTVDSTASQKIVCMWPIASTMVEMRYSDSRIARFRSDPNAEVSPSGINLTFDGLNTTLVGINPKAIAGDRALSLIYPDYDNGKNGMAANITNSFNSGVMHGDIRGAWLADTDDTDLVGSELVTNGDFETALGAEWNLNNSLLEIVAGQLQVTQNSATDWGSAQQYLTGLVVGKQYVMSGDFIADTADGRAYILSATGEVVNMSSNQSWSFTFTAVNTSDTIILMCESVIIGQINYWDNVSVRLADADRSYKNNALAVHGTVTRTPVATGAELVGYSGFSVDNFLQQEYNSDLDFGTGNFYIKSWGFTSSNATSQHILRRDTAVGNDAGRVMIRLNALKFELRIGSFTLISTTTYNDEQLHLFEAWRKDGAVYIAVDNIIIASGVNTTNMDIATGILFVGTDQAGLNNWGGGLALIKFGATVPSAEQRAIKYEQEKRLFNENAKCTLQGSSSDVKAVDHDESNDLLTACSADWVTRFNGLVVVDDWEEVATSVSTVTGKELTNA